MSVQQPSSLYSQGTGTRPENVEIPVVTNTNPSSTGPIFPIGKRWINTATNSEYVLTSETTSNGVTTSNWALGAGTVSGGGYEYTVVTANTQMVVNAGYIANKSGTICTLTLPATAAVGDSVSVLGLGSTLWLIAQNAGQTIRINGASSTTGATGSLSAIDQYNCAELVCVVANTDWVVKSAMGILTVT